MEVPQAFCVHDAATANWVIRKIMEARQYAERTRQRAAAEARRAEREEEFLLFRFGEQLKSWARQKLEADNTNRKSINLPAGTIGFRIRPARIDIVDEEKVLSW